MKIRGNIKRMKFKDMSIGNITYHMNGGWTVITTINCGEISLYPVGTVPGVQISR